MGSKKRIDDTIDEDFYEEHFGQGNRVDSVAVRNLTRMLSVFDVPVTWFRKYVVERLRGKPYPYYHQQFKRVPTIDQCYTDDEACVWEANEQYDRDRKVDSAIVNILRQRFSRCMFYNRGVNEYYNWNTMCPKEREQYKQAELNFFIKYGDIGAFSNVIDAYMKQKHRLIIERRRALASQEKNGNEECNQ